MRPRRRCRSRPCGSAHLAAPESARRSDRRQQRPSRARACRAAARGSSPQPRWRRSSSTLPLTPRPSSISVCLGARDHVARRELHRVRRVALEEALAVRVEEVGALAAAPSVISTPVGDSVVGWNCIISMSLSATPMCERERHPVAGARVGVRRADVETARAAGGEDDRLRTDRLHPAVRAGPSR